MREKGVAVRDFVADGADAIVSCRGDIIAYMYSLNPTNTELPGERRLAAEMLIAAIVDITTARNQRVASEAVRWVRGMNPDPYGFNELCGWLDIEPSWLRDQVMRVWQSRKVKGDLWIEAKGRVMRIRRSGGRKPHPGGR